MIKREAPPEDREELLQISKQVETCIRDRNIIVHGLAHMKLKPEHYTGASSLPIGAIGPEEMERVPCWTIFMGEEKGRNFPISHTAVITVRENIGKVADRVAAFNARRGFGSTHKAGDQVESGWPAPL